MTENIDKPYNTGCSWERYLREPKALDLVVKAILPTLRKKKKEFDGFVVSGYSMSLIAPILAHKMNKALCIVNKVGEYRNSSYKVEGLHSQRWVMVDDLVSMGFTLAKCGRGVESIQGSLVGIVTYHQKADEPTISYTTEKNVVVHVPRWLGFDAYTLMREAGLE